MPSCARLLLRVQVRESLMARAADFGIVLDDVAITHLSFGTEVRAGAWGEGGSGRGRAYGQGRGRAVQKL